jgi:hypothetical protein
MKVQSTGDLWYIAEDWLDIEPSLADLYEDGFIDFRDFARLAEVWMIDQ